MPNMAIIVLTGHIGGTPELKYLNDGTPVMKFSLCVNTGYGERKSASWYNCSMFGKRVEKLAQYIGKGKPITIHGEPSIRKWKSETTGKEGTSVEVRVADIILLGSKDEHQAPREDADPETSLADDGNVPF